MPGAGRDRAIGAPTGQIDGDAARVECSEPLERVVIDWVRAKCAIGGEESLAEASSSRVDDGPKRARKGERGIGQQVGEIKVVRRMCNLARRPVKDDPLIVVREHIERVQVTMTDHPHFRVGSGSGESSNRALQGKVVEFVGS